MKKRTELDERQLWQRGNVFKHAFVFLIAALALEALCKAFGVAWAQGPWEAILIIWASVALCWWEFILRDINPMGRSQKTFFFAMGLCGLSMVVMELASLAAGRGPLLEEGTLTSGGAITLTGCLMASILAVYLAKSFREKRRPAGDED